MHLEFIFIPIVVETFNALGSQTVSLLSKLVRRESPWHNGYHAGLCN